jgi:Domain of unknown function (DUF6285)
MQYRPEHTDLLEAIQDFLIKEVLPFVKEQDALAYKTLVSWNMLGVIGRELKGSRPLLEEDAKLLGALTGQKPDVKGMGDRELLKSTHELGRAAAQKIRAQKSLPGGDEWKTVKEVLKHNLQISNPRYGAE